MAPEAPLGLDLAKDHALDLARAVLTVFIMTGKMFIISSFHRSNRVRRNTRSGSLGSLSCSSSQRRKFRPLHHFGYQERVLELTGKYLKSDRSSLTNQNTNKISYRKMLPSGAAGQRLLSNLLGVQSDINPSHAISQLIGKIK